MPPVDMRTAAVAAHEMLLSYMAAGFTRAEAMQLVAGIVYNSTR